MQNCLVKFLETNTDYLKIYITPSLNNLSKNDFQVKLNNVIFTDFYLELISDSQYKITPTNFFSIYDELSVFIKNNNVISNFIEVCLCKVFNDGEETINYTIPNLESGIYTISTDTLNELDFNISTEPVPICNGISESSTLTFDQYDSTNQILSLNVNLLDSFGIKAPTGGYIINFKLEKI